MEVDASNDTYEPLIALSHKRTYDLFLRNYGGRLAEDVDSQKMKLAVKVNDEYARVRNLPPPPKRAATESAKARATAPATSTPTETTNEEVVVKGGHSVPSGPGISISDDTTAPQEEPSPEAFSALLRDLPSRKEPDNTWGIVEYKAAAGIDERFKPPSTSRALTHRKGLNLEKPQWHPPWKLMRVISGHLGWVRAVAVEPGNEWFATGSADRTIKIWDLASGTLKLTLTGHINCPRGLAVSTRHPYLFSCAEDKMVRCWDLEYNKAIRNYHGHLSAVYCLALHPTIDLLVTGGRDSVARVWDIRTKSQVHVLQGHSATVGTLACQGSDPQILSGSMDSTVRLWDLAAGKSMVTLTNHKKGVRSLVVHPQEFSFVSASADNIKKWKLPEGNFLQNCSGHNTIVNTVAVNADNVLMSGGDNGSMYFWDWKTGYNFQQLVTKVQPGSLDCEAAIYAATFDQSGARLITCEADKTIKIWKEDADATEEEYPIDWKPSRSEKRW